MQGYVVMLLRDSEEDGANLVDLLLPKASPRSFRERYEPFLEVPRVGLQPTVGIEGGRILEDFFGTVDEDSATANDGLMVVSRLPFPTRSDR